MSILKMGGHVVEWDALIWLTRSFTWHKIEPDLTLYGPLWGRGTGIPSSGTTTPGRRIVMLTPSRIRIGDLISQ